MGFEINLRLITQSFLEKRLRHMFYSFWLLVDIIIRVYIFSTCLVDITSGPDGQMTVENPGKGGIDIFSIF